MGPAGREEAAETGRGGGGGLAEGRGAQRCASWLRDGAEGLRRAAGWPRAASREAGSGAAGSSLP